MSDDPRRWTGVGVRRVSELDPTPLPDSDPRLVARIVAEIDDAGPMTFARFMELALYDPEAGYYAAGAAGAAAPAGAAPRTAGPGRFGDFLTAPEAHPIFGWTIARHLASVWVELGRPAKFVIREHGAGSGALAAGILDGLRRSSSQLLDAVRYQAIDISAARLAALEERLTALGLDRVLEPPDDRAAPGAILANELLDALPVHRLEGGADGSLLELFVTVAPRPEDGSRAHPKSTRPFATILAPPSTPSLAARLADERIALLPGQQVEVCLAMDNWLASAVAPLERGVLLLIDYGYPASQLYDPVRGSTLLAYHGHRVHADPLVAIGRQDLTAHVDLTAVERAAAAAGLEPLGSTTQARFLDDLGAGELLVALQTDPTSTLESYLEARSALMRMLDPRATGAFAVLAFGRGLPSGARLRGLSPPVT